MRFVLESAESGVRGNLMTFAFASHRRDEDKVLSAHAAWPSSDVLS